MIRCFELILLHDLEDGFPLKTYLQDAHEGVLLLILALFSALAKVEEVDELVWELLEVNHDLLLVLQDVVVLLRAVHLVHKVWVFVVCQLYRQHLGLLGRGVRGVDNHFDVQLGHEVLAVVRLYAD